MGVTGNLIFVERNEMRIGFITAVAKMEKDVFGYRWDAINIRSVCD